MPDMLDKIIAEAHNITARYSRQPWIVYSPTDDEYSYYVELPGIKLIISNTNNYNEVKKFADAVVKKMLSVGTNVELVTVDKSRLKQYE